MSQQQEDFVHFQVQQQQQQQSMANYQMGSELTSPTSSAINLITSMDSHRPSLQNSPLNLTSSLSNLSFSNNKDTQPQTLTQQQPQQHQHHHHHPQQHQTQPQQQQP
ncbi:hypothetical protein WICPIJ_006028, partial [Wickerhamomyces pijperi]